MEPKLETAQSGNKIIENEDAIARAKVLLVGQGVRFIESTPPHFPELDYRALAPEGIDPAFVKEVITLMLEYLSWPIVEDTFTNDKERAAWKEKLYADLELGRAYGELLERNQLRVNRVAGLTMSIDEMIGDVKQKAPGARDLLQTLTEIRNTLPTTQSAQKYRESSLEQKKETVALIRKKLEEFILLFAAAKKVQYAQAG